MILKRTLTSAILAAAIFIANVAYSDEEPTTQDSSDWTNHFQATTVTQARGRITSPYAAENSLAAGYENRTSLTATLFTGHKLWSGAYAIVNPEESAGSGLSGTHGIAGFPNGEIYRVDDPNPRINLARAFIQQDISLGGPTEKIEDDLNQFSATKAIDRVTIVAGEFSLNDYFDDNSYSHDPRTQFLNWALMDNGAWDYASDTHGYTWGLYLELHLTQWSVRFAAVQEPTVANQLDLDPHILKANSENAEVEYRYTIQEKPGKARFLFFTNHADMGNYQDSLNLAAQTHSLPDITQTRNYSTKWGMGLNFEQEVTSELGLFSRLSWNNGTTESWAFSEIDDAFSLGASLKGTPWHRPDDVTGLALVVNGLSHDHLTYLTAGGQGFMLGDGGLNYSPEEILEFYYLYKLSKPVGISPDFQYVRNPAYNADRGPAAVFALRLHYQI
jgi:high affinity Mn2+ porin